MCLRADLSGVFTLSPLLIVVIVIVILCYRYRIDIHYFDTGRAVLNIRNEIGHFRYDTIQWAWFTLCSVIMSHFLQTEDTLDAGCSASSQPGL